MTKLPNTSESRTRLDPRRVQATADAVRKLFDREPPHSIHAERSLLGALILDPTVMADVIDILDKSEHFYSEVNRAVFESLRELYEIHQAGDLVLLAEALRKKGVLDQIGGTKYLMTLAESVPSAANAPHYARIIADRSRLRMLIDAAGEIMYDAFNSGDVSYEGAHHIIDEAERRVFEISEQASDYLQKDQSLYDLVEAEIVRLEQADGTEITGVPTGFDDLDKQLSGLQRGELLILAARPSMGKTAFSLNVAEQVAFGGTSPWSPPGKRHIPVGFFSLEMSKSALVQRLISARSGVDASKIRTGALSKSELESVTGACRDLADAPIYIDDSPALSVIALRARARRMKRKYKIEMLVVDYLQLLTAPWASKESRQAEVSAISRGIKALARELEIPVVCLAQLNRGAEQRERNRPRMSDLRESGSIEQDADVVMLLHREAYYHRDDPEWVNDPDNTDKLNLTELIVAKQRNGPTGLVKLTWDEKTTRFKSFDWRHAGDFGAPPPAPAERAAHGFAPGGRTGPVDGFRDGGGPPGRDDDFNDDELPPF